jgi:diaminopimelate epimerase
VRFLKGHGTENDFVLLPEPPDGLDAELARALCDRHAGIGADGVLAVRRDGDGTFFMDYRNSDGSLSETCGNGIRVYARYLVTAGLAAAGDIVIRTRAGDCRVTVPADGRDIAVEMGIPSRLSDAKVTIGTTSWPAYAYSFGNPHLVVPDAGPLDALDLTVAPTVTPAEAFPDGANVELVEPAGAQRIRMRVHERGSGETRSCGSGACAAAVAAMEAEGVRGTWEVMVPGGSLSVTWRHDDVVVLSGPAVLVASGEVDPDVIRSSAARAGATMTEL